MGTNSRVLLVEYLDAIGAAPADARHHVAALRAAGWRAEAIVLEGAGRDDLLFPGIERAGAGFDVLRDDDAGRARLAARVRASRADLVLWASATPGGGAAAHALPAGIAAAWWPTGHAGALAAPGPLAPLAPGLAPVDGSVLPGDGSERRRLALWDGPFVLVPARAHARTAARLVEAFAHAALESGEADLVVLDHPEPAVEMLARRAGLAPRVHFVGPAPREAEHAWLATAALALLPGEAALSGGMLLRALAAGCPLCAVGEAARPLEHWLLAHGLAWSEGDGALGEAVAAALERAPEVLAARERGRAVAAAHDIGALGAALAVALRAARGSDRRAA